MRFQHLFCTKSKIPFFSLNFVLFTDEKNRFAKIFFYPTYMVAFAMFKCGKIISSFRSHRHILAKSVRFSLQACVALMKRFLFPLRPWDGLGWFSSFCFANFSIKYIRSLRYRNFLWIESSFHFRFYN